MRFNKAQSRELWQAEGYSSCVQVRYHGGRRRRPPARPGARLNNNLEQAVTTFATADLTWEHVAEVKEQERVVAPK